MGQNIETVKTGSDSEASAEILSIVKSAIPGLEAHEVKQDAEAIALVLKRRRIYARFFADLKSALKGHIENGVMKKFYRQEDHYTQGDGEWIANEAKRLGFNAISYPSGVEIEWQHLVKQLREQSK
jgi:hypothetical protein